MRTVATVIRRRTRPGWPRATLRLRRRRPVLVAIQRHLADRQANLGRQHALGGAFGQLAEQRVMAELAGFVLAQYALVQQALDEVAE